MVILGPSPTPQQRGCEGEGRRRHLQVVRSRVPSGVDQGRPTFPPPTLISKNTPGVGHWMPRPAPASRWVLSIPFRAEPVTRSGPTWDARCRAGLAFLGRTVEAVALPGPRHSPQPYLLRARTETLRSPPNPSLASPAPQSPTGPRGLRDPAWPPAPPWSPGLGLGFLRPSGLQSSGLSCP